GARATLVRSRSALLTQQWLGAAQQFGEIVRAAGSDPVNQAVEPAAKGPKFTTQWRSVRAKLADVVSAGLRRVETKPSARRQPLEDRSVQCVRRLRVPAGGRQRLREQPGVRP